jgi:hypothetical protein
VYSRTLAQPTRMPLVSGDVGEKARDIVVSDQPRQPDRRLPMRVLAERICPMSAEELDQLPSASGVEDSAKEWRVPVLVEGIDRRTAVD